MANDIPRNFTEARDIPPPICGFRIVNDISRNLVAIREVPVPNCGLCVVNGISRNFVEIREMPFPNCGFHFANRISRNLIEKHEKGRLPTVDSALAIVLRATSLRSTRLAASKLWIPRCQ